jgi:hypothetical protein
MHRSPVRKTMDIVGNGINIMIALDRAFIPFLTNLGA